MSTRDDAIAAFRAAVPGLHYDLSPTQEGGVEGAYMAGRVDGKAAGLMRAIEIADSVGHQSDGAKHVAAILRSELAGTEAAK